MIIYFHGIDEVENYKRVRVLVLFTTFRFLLRLAVVLFYFNNCIQRSLMNTIHSVLILSIFIVSRIASVTMLVYPHLTIFGYIYYCAYAVGTAYFVAQTGMWIHSLRKKLSFSSHGNSSMRGGLHNGTIYLAGLIFEIVSFFVIPYFFSGSGRLSTFSAKSLAGKQYAQIIVTLIMCTIPSRHSRDESLSRLADSRTKKSFKKYLSAEITRPLGTIALGLQVLEEMVESLAGVVPSESSSSSAAKGPSSLEMLSVDSSSEGEANSREKEFSARRRPPSSGMDDTTADRRHKRHHKDEDDSAVVRYNKKIQQIVATKQSCDTALKQLQRLLQQDRFDNGILALELEYVKLVPFLVGALKAVVSAANSDTKTPRPFRYDIGTNSQLDSVQPRYRDMYIKVDRQYLSEVVKAVVVQALRVASPLSEVFFELVVVDNYDSLSLSNMLRLSVHFEAALSRPEPRHLKSSKSDMSPTSSSSAALVLPFRSGPHGEEDAILSMEEGERQHVRANPLQGPRTLTLADMFESSPGTMQGRTKRTAHTSTTLFEEEARLDEADSDAEDLPDGVAPAAITRYVPSGVKGCGSILSQHLAEEILKLHDGAVTGTALVSSGTGGENSGVINIVNKSVYSVELPYFKQILLHNSSLDYDEEDDENSPPQVWSRPVSRQHMRSSLDSSNNNSRENSAQRRSYHSTGGGGSVRKNGAKPSPSSARKGPHAAMKSLPAIRSFRHKVVPGAAEGAETFPDTFDAGL
jgi:hypothetical protein